MMYKIGLAFFVLLFAGLIAYTGNVGFLFYALFVYFFSIAPIRYFERHFDQQAAKVYGVLCLLVLTTLFATVPVFSGGSHRGEMSIFSIHGQTLASCFINLALMFFVRSWYFSKKTESWYHQIFPQQIVRGKIRCFSCGSGYLKGYNLYNRTYMKRMFCGKCNTTLFFSPEGR